LPDPAPATTTDPLRAFLAHRLATQKPTFEPAGVQNVPVALAVQPQDLALTIFGAYLRERGDRAWSGGMVELLGEFGFSTEAARAALARLATRQLIARTKVGRQVFYTLTPRAQALLEEGDGRIFGFGDADAKAPAEHWTVLWHSLPETHRVERARLGRRLRFLGFGSVQDATWVAPHDREREVVALLDSLDIAGYAYVMVGRPTEALHAGTLVEQAWDLASVSDAYDDFLREFGPYRTRRARAALGDREAFVVRTRALHLFRGFPFLDPELPDELMPRPAPEDGPRSSSSTPTSRARPRGTSPPSRARTSPRPDRAERRRSDQRQSPQSRGWAAGHRR
jgi:phenylacetic acid degradation operon negative regulatory protein